MKNTLKKGIMLLVLALLVAGGVFAQKVGDTIQAGGKDYRVEEVRGTAGWYCSQYRHLTGFG